MQTFKLTLDYDDSYQFSQALAKFREELNGGGNPNHFAFIIAHLLLGADIQGKLVVEQPEEGTFLTQFLEVDSEYGTVTLPYDVYDVNEYERDNEGYCAFCHGDCLGDENRQSNIAIYRSLTPRFQTCPVCQGRPT